MLNTPQKINLKLGLSIVIPFFNEGENTKKAMACAMTAAEKCDFPFEVILANDGSTDGYLESELPKNVKIVNLDHAGRISTRLSGAIHAIYPNILFIDARVWIHQDSLFNLNSLVQKYPDSLYWNGFVKSLNIHLPQVSIWETLVQVGWSRIYTESETAHFGIKDFDRYPKGTGLFLTSKNEWIFGLKEVQRLEKQATTSISDDTALLRKFAMQSDIWIDKSFSADYSPRINFLEFLKNARYRGETFVDSYWSSNTIFSKLVRITPLVLLLIPTIYIVAGLKALMFFILAALTLIGMVFFIFCFKQWKNLFRALSETIVLFPLMINFGYGYLKAYSFRLGVRRNSSTKQRSPE